MISPADYDLLMDQWGDASTCPKCGSLTPARLDADGCSDCTEYPRCGFCGRWVGDGQSWLPGYVLVSDAAGADVRCCSICWESAD